MTVSIESQQKDDVAVKLETKFAYMLIIASPSLRMANCPWKGRGHVTWRILNFQSPLRYLWNGLVTAELLVRSAVILQGYLWDI